MPSYLKPLRSGVTGASVVAADIFCEGQSGVNGVAVDPSFSENRFVYVFAASNITTSPRTNRIIRLKVSDDLSSVSERTDIVTDISFKDVANAVGSAGSHSGGRLRFGPDGYLYATTGDKPPLWSNGGNSDGMGPCTFIVGRTRKAWHGRLAVGIIGAQQLDVLEVSSDMVLGAIVTPDLPQERLRSIVLGPDGLLYLITDAGEIWKITPS